MNKNEISANELEIILKERGNRHKTYKHYKRRDFLLSGLEPDKDGNYFLYLNDGQKWEDLVDQENFLNDDPKYKKYAMCFSYGTNENMALWMINGDIKHTDGALISLPNAFLRKILNNIQEVELCDIDKEKKDFKHIDYAKVNKNNIELIDMYYLNPNAREKRASFGDKHYYISDSTYKKTKALSKAYGYKYENECRLTIKIDKKQVTDESHYIKIKLSKEEAKEIREKYLIEDPINKNPKYLKSDYAGKIDFRQKAK